MKGNLKQPDNFTTCGKLNLEIKQYNNPKEVRRCIVTFKMVTKTMTNPTTPISNTQGNPSPKNEKKTSIYSQLMLHLCFDHYNHYLVQLFLAKPTLNGSTIFVISFRSWRVLSNSSNFLFNRMFCPSADCNVSSQTAMDEKLGSIDQRGRETDLTELQQIIQFCSKITFEIYCELSKQDNHA